MASFPFVQAKQTTNTAAVTFDSTSTAGDIIVAYYGVNAGSGVVLPTSVTDNNGNIYHKVSTLGDSEGLTIMFVAVNIIVTPHNPITVTFNGAAGAAGGGPSLIILEYGAPAAFQVFSVECNQGSDNCRFQYQGITLNGTTQLNMIWAGQAAFGNSHESAIIFANQFNDVLLVGGNYDNHTSHTWTVSPGAATVRAYTTESGGQTGAVADWPVTLVTACGTESSPLEALCNDPPSGAVGVPYTHTFTASGGTPPYTFAITSGSLPDGLTMSSAGVVTGTPTTPGTSSFTVTVTDADADTSPVSCSVTISGGITTSCNAPPGGLVGVPYTHTFTASGGTAPYTFAITAGSLPPGLSMDTAGNVTGTPTLAGTFSFTVTATDANGLKNPVNCSITIGTIPPSPTNVYFCLQKVVVGLRKAQRLPVRGSAS